MKGKLQRESTLACGRQGGGFTLIEVLVVTTLFSLIAVGVATAFLSGIRLWERAQTVNRFYRDVLLTLEGIAREFHHSTAIPSIPYQGTSQEVSFPTVIENSIVQLTYQFHPEERLLSRKEVSLHDRLAGKEEAVDIENPVVSMDELTLNYLYFDPDNKTYQWNDSWSKEKGIFAGIRWRGKINGEEFTKTLLLPSA